MKKIYAQATDAANTSSAFNSESVLASWTLGSGNIAPVNQSLSPKDAVDRAGTKRLFTAIYRDQNGVADIQNARLQVSNIFDSRFGAQVYYLASTNKLYLYNDAGNALLGGFAPGSANNISNSQVTLNCAETTVTRLESGLDLQIEWSLTPNASSFQGAKRLYAQATDTAGLRSPFNSQLGTWTLGTNSATSVVYVTPNNPEDAAGTKRTFTTIYEDLDGWADILKARFLITSGTSSSSINSLFGFYNRSSNKLYLFSDNGASALGGFSPGSANIIRNAQGALNCAETTVKVISATQIEIKWSFTPASTFSGIKQLRVAGTDLVESGGSLDATYGTWTLNAYPTSVVSVTPNNAVDSAGATRNFTTIYEDLNGAKDILKARFLITSGTSSSSINSLFGFYNLDTGKLYLIGDDGGTLLGGFAPGSANTISNSQGTLNCADVIIRGIGVNQIEIQWSFTPAATFSGVKQLRASGTDRAESGSSLDVTYGTWTLNAPSPSANSF